MTNSRSLSIHSWYLAVVEKPLVDNIAQLVERDLIVLPVQSSLTTYSMSTFKKIWNNTCRSWVPQVNLIATFFQNTKNSTQSAIIWSGTWMPWITILKIPKQLILTWSKNARINKLKVKIYKMKSLRCGYFSTRRDSKLNRCQIRSRKTWRLLKKTRLG